MWPQSRYRGRQGVLSNASHETARLGGFRTILVVPLLREGVPIGILAMHRAAVRPFTQKQIELVETFADQAVIAIENVRLFEAEQQRTRELTESLEQQTASSEVLQIISSSPGELDPVFQSILANGIRLCEANFGVLFRFADDGVGPPRCLVCRPHLPSSGNGAPTESGGRADWAGL